MHRTQGTGRPKRSAEVHVIVAPTLSLDSALSMLPRDLSNFDVVRHRWIRVARSHPALTGAERCVALALAQEFINRDPEVRGYRTAWPGHSTIATAVGYDKRTVLSAIAKLRIVGLLAVEPGGGRPARGGSTDRYTLRIDQLDLLERTAKLEKEAKKFRLLQKAEFHSDVQPDEKHSGSDEEIDRKKRNLPQKEVKGFRPNLTESYSESLTKESFDRSLLGNEALLSKTVTAVDHDRLSRFMGSGDVQLGYSILDRLDLTQINELAVRVRDGSISQSAALAEVQRLETSRKLA